MRATSTKKAIPAGIIFTIVEKKEVESVKLYALVEHCYVFIPCVFSFFFSSRKEFREIDSPGLINSLGHSNVNFKYL